jgi:hypothetical protein
VREIVELSVDQRDLLLERLAQKLSRCGLTAPAILFLEANKPFSFIGSQVLLFFQPLLGFLLDDEIIGGYAQLFEDQANVERLLHLLEQY